MSIKGQKQFVVNYHHIDSKRGDLRGVHPLSIENFEKQVAFLAKNFKIVSVPEVFVAANKNSSEKLCSITFDDCLKNQFFNAVPILKKYKTTATFFPITATFEGYVPVAHKIHILLSNMNIKDLIIFFESFMRNKNPDLIEKYRIPLDRRLVMKRLHEEIPVANFKEMFSILPNDLSSDFFKNAFEILNIDEIKVCADMFMSKEEILSLNNDGYCIGGHTHKHYVLDTLEESAIKDEILTGLNQLAPLLGHKPNVFSYPHGRYTDTVLRVVKDIGFKYGVTIERRGLSANENPLIIPRYDALDFELA